MSNFSELNYSDLYWEPPRIKVDLKTDAWMVSDSSGNVLPHYFLSKVELEVVGDWEKVGVSKAGLEEELREVVLATIKKHEVENRERKPTMVEQNNTPKLLAAILAEMRDDRIIRLDDADVTRCLLHNLADRIEAAVKQEYGNVAMRRKGRWKNGSNYEYEYAYCSECGRAQWAGWDSHKQAEENIESFADDYRFCPVCGAEMDGGVYVK